MNLRVVKHEYREVETNFELPVYLYYQDEFCNDELIKLTEKELIRVKYNFNSFSISVETDYQIRDTNLEKTLTTEKHFNSIYFQALSQLSEAVSITE